MFNKREELNLERLDQKSKRILAYILTHYQDSLLWSRYREYQYKDQVYTLSHEIIRRERKEKREGFRYEIIANTPLGRGGFSQVFSTVATLKTFKIGVETTLFGKFKPRAVKVQACSGYSGSSKFSQAWLKMEYIWIRELPHLHAKPPSFADSHGYLVMKKMPGISLESLAYLLESSVYEFFPMSILSHNLHKEDGRLYLKAWDDKLEYKLISIDGVIKTGRIAWKDLPKDFPRNEEDIFQLKWGEKHYTDLLELTTRAGHTRAPENFGLAQRLELSHLLIEAYARQVFSPGLWHRDLKDEQVLVDFGDTSLYVLSQLPETLQPYKGAYILIEKEDCLYFFSKDSGEKTEEKLSSYTCLRMNLATLKPIQSQGMNGSNLILHYRLTTAEVLQWILAKGGLVHFGLPIEVNIIDYGLSYKIPTPERCDGYYLSWSIPREPIEGICFILGQNELFNQEVSEQRPRSIYVEPHRLNELKAKYPNKERLYSLNYAEVEEFMALAGGIRILGNPLYRPAEILLNKNGAFASYGSKTEIFSLGLLLIDIWQNKNIPGPDNLFALKRLRQKPVSLDLFHGNLDKELTPEALEIKENLKKLLTWMLALDPENRAELSQVCDSFSSIRNSFFKPKLRFEAHNQVEEEKAKVAESLGFSCIASTGIYSKSQQNFFPSSKQEKDLEKAEPGDSFKVDIK